MKAPTDEPPHPRSGGHFVYVYHEEGKAGRPVYVGYGRSSDRASQHLVASHNPALTKFLAEGRYRISIAGPFSTEEIGRAVETALISALAPAFNENSGPSAWRFRPLGVPEAYAERQVALELALEGFLTAQGPSPKPVLFVIVNTVELPYDGRAGYDPATPPEDAVVRIRVDRWWQLGRLISEWTKVPERRPGVLVGVFGPPGRQTVIASLQIDQSGWATAERRPDNQGRVRVPLANEDELDAFSLRGRRISRAAGVKFGSFATESFAILDPSGCLAFGRRARDRKQDKPLP